MGINVIEELKCYIETMQVEDNVKAILIGKIEEIALKIQQDMLEKQLLEKKSLEHAEKCSFYEASINALPNPVFIKNEKGEFVYFNEAYQKYFGMEREVYLNKTVLDLEFLPMVERERYQKEDLELIQSGQIQHYDMDFALPNGEIGHSLYWSRGFAVEGSDAKGLVGEIVDISTLKKLQNEITSNAKQLKEANLKIEKMMSQDFLTGLYNRRAIEDNIPKIDAMVMKEESSISLIMADLDRFKIVNDTYGHTVGDEVLVNFSNILKSCSRKDDLVIRFGGEEFLIVLFDTKIQVAEIVAERIRAMTEEKLFLPNGKTNTVSIGVSELSKDKSKQEIFAAALARVDEALYCAKKGGRNKVVSWVSCNR
ncbi:MAG: diguanylate cyclase [Eubacteriales bacterium]